MTEYRLGLRDVRRRTERAVPLGLGGGARPRTTDAALGARLVEEERRIAMGARMLAVQPTERPDEEVAIANAACKPVTAGAVTSSTAAFARRARACAARLSLRPCCCMARGAPVDGIVTARRRRWALSALGDLACSFCGTMLHSFGFRLDTKPAMADGHTCRGGYTAAGASTNAHLGFGKAGRGLVRSSRCMYSRAICCGSVLPAGPCNLF